MAKYSISEEGIMAMKALSNKILMSANGILEANILLNTSIISCEDGLGLYCSEIVKIIEKNKVVLKDNHDNIMALAQNIANKAEEIEELVLFDLELVSTATSTGGGSPNNVVRSNECISSNSLVPNRSTPRDLPASQYGYKEDANGNLVYDSPMELNDYLYKTQGMANSKFKGTCGLCSCANILRLSGVNLGEADMIDYASKTSNPNSILGKLCEVGHLSPGSNGGTSPMDRKFILEHFGIDSGICDIDVDFKGEILDSNIDKIANYVSLGRGVILSVHAQMLWYDFQFSTNDYHAVTVTSVKKAKDGTVLGFYICDSAKGGTKYYLAEKLKNALTGAKMNVTHGIIR